MIVGRSAAMVLSSRGQFLLLSRLLVPSAVVANATREKGDRHARE
jgi:hypothetical protein